MEELTYEEWLEAKLEAQRDFQPTDYKKNMANTMFLILNAEHVGKNKVICADKLAEKMSAMLGESLNRGHVSECARLFRECGNFPGLQSCIKGYYVDNSYEAMMRTLRFVFTKCSKLERTAENIKRIISNKYGEDAVPEDLREWLRQLEFEDWCERNDAHPSEEWCLEHGFRYNDD